MSIGSPTASQSARGAHVAQGIALRVLYVFNYGCNVTLMTFFNVYLVQLGFSGAALGLLGGIRPAATLVSQPLWGVVADVWGRRRVLALTMALSTLAILGYLAGASVAFIVLWTIVFSVLSSPIGALIDSLVLDHLGERKERFGNLRLWGSVGWAGFALIAGQALSGRDLRLMFVMSGSLMLAGLAVVLRTRQPSGAAARVAGGWRGAGVLLRNRPLAVALALAALAQCGIASYYTFFPIYLEAMGATRPQIGLAYTLQGVSELPVFLLSGWLLRRLGVRVTLVLALAVFATRMFLYSILSQPLPAIALGLTHGLSFSLLLVSFISHVNNLTPPQWRATGQSLLWAAFWGVGAIVGNAWAGMIHDRVGAHTVFRIDALLLALVAVAAAAVIHGKESASALSVSTESADARGK